MYSEGKANKSYKIFNYAQRRKTIEKENKEANKITKDWTDIPGINLNFLMDRKCENRQQKLAFNQVFSRTNLF